MLTAGINAAKLLKYTYFKLVHLNERSATYNIHIFLDICGDRKMFRAMEFNLRSRTESCSCKLSLYVTARTKPLSFKIAF